MTYILQCTEPRAATGQFPRVPEVVIEKFPTIGDAKAFANSYALAYFMVRVIDDTGRTIYRLDDNEVMYDLYTG